MLIGLTGKKNSGKDEVFRVIEELDTHGQNIDVIRLAFADAMKGALAALFAVPYSVIEENKNNGEISLEFPGTGNQRYGYNDHHTDKYHVTLRQAIQRFGTEVGRRHFGEDFWLDKLIPPTVQPSFHKGRIVVVTDVRFRNEAERIVKLGGHIWEVTRPDTDNTDAHSSESGIDSKLINGHINNDGSVEDLRERVREALFLISVW
jgi:hypothetical protein